MEISDLPEPLRRRMAEQAAQPPIDTVREFLHGNVADAESLDEVRAHLRRLARSTTRMHHRVLTALETVLATSWPAGTLAQLVGWDGNWVLDDPSDVGAAVFLRGLADMLREVIGEVE
ncbi:hypothetical protein ACQP2F_08020 [Actinoplanes sp. CA-030573]|uniref:hypothetical protein n=1 Tax=Actinoplanes sp. CA-030573 TaxID=3239898 RepID=UPI003D9028E6